MLTMYDSSISNTPRSIKCQAELSVLYNMYTRTCVKRDRTDRFADV